MTTYRTGNPIGSKDPRDLYDNAENFDAAINDVENPSFEDRFGRQRTTLKGYDDQFQQFLINSGYENIGDYAAGLEITARNQIFWRDGELYRAGAVLELPYTTTGDWGVEEGLFVAVGDQALRQELSGPFGASMIGSGSFSVDTVSDLLSIPLDKRKPDIRYLVKSYYSDSPLGGGDFYYDPNRASENDGGSVLDGFVRILNSVITPFDFGITQDPSELDKDVLSATLAVAAAVGVPVLFPKKEYLIDTSEVMSIVFPSGSLVDIHPEAVFRAMPATRPDYNIFWLSGVDNVTIRFNGAKIIGDRDEHLGVGGEAGHGIGIRHCKNISIFDPDISNCWGDGILIDCGRTPDSNIYIHRPSCDNNRRQGISIISIDGLTVFEPRLTNTNGTAPEAGMDLEPNFATERLTNVKIIRPYAENNAGGGLILYLLPLTISSIPVDVEIESPTLVRNAFVLVDNGTEGARGTVTVNNPVVIDAPFYAYGFPRQNASSVKCVLRNPVAINPNRGKTPSIPSGSAFSVNPDGNSYHIGSLEIINPELIVNNEDGDSPNGFIYASANPPYSLINFRVIDPISSGSQAEKYSMVSELNSANCIVTDRFEAVTRQMGATGLLLGANTFIASQASSQFELVRALPVGYEVTIVCEHPSGSIRIRLDYGLPEGQRIFPGGFREYNLPSFGGNRGCRITLKRVVGGYMILNQIGDWSGVG